MPRGRRLLYDNATYHIIQRGHNKETLFKTRGDYIAFKDMLRLYKSRYRFDVYHYCIMSNHFHLLLKISVGIELPRVLQSITQAYSFYYRRVYNHCGYVYQNRYKSLLIKSDAYLLECGRYIERNPLRAGVVKELSSYTWSSYNFYTNGKKDDIITVNPLYTALHPQEGNRRNAYITYILQERPYEMIIDNAIMNNG